MVPKGFKSVKIRAVTNLGITTCLILCCRGAREREIEREGGEREREGERERRGETTLKEVNYYIYFSLTPVKPLTRRSYFPPPKIFLKGLRYRRSTQNIGRGIFFKIP